MSATFAFDDLLEQIAERVASRLQSSTSTDIFPPDRLTFTEADSAEILGVPRHVLKGCRERGEIKPIKIGKKWHYSREVLLDFVRGAK